MRYFYDWKMKHQGNTSCEKKEINEKEGKDIMSVTYNKINIKPLNNNKI